MIVPSVLSMKMTYRLQVGIFLLVNWFDVVFTAYIVMHGGLELMPIAQFFIVNFGLDGLIAFKTLATLGVLLLLDTLGMGRLLMYINIIMCIVCFTGLLSVLTIASA